MIPMWIRVVNKTIDDALLICIEQSELFAVCSEHIKSNSNKTCFEEYQKTLENAIKAILDWIFFQLCLLLCQESSSRASPSKHSSMFSKCRPNMPWLSRRRFCCRAPDRIYDNYHRNRHNTLILMTFWTTINDDSGLMAGGVSLLFLSPPAIETYTGRIGSVMQNRSIEGENARQNSNNSSRTWKMRENCWELWEHTHFWIINCRSSSPISPIWMPSLWKWVFRAARIP